MTRNTLLTFNKLANTIIEQSKTTTAINPKFIYALKKNQEKMKTLLQEIYTTMLTMIKNYKKPEREDEFHDKRIELCEKYCMRDENGKPIMEDNQYIFNEENRKIFKEEFNKLQEEYKDVVNAIIEFEDAVQKYLDEDVEYIPYYIDINCISEGILTGEQVLFLIENNFIQNA